MPGKVFISYSSADQETANKLVVEIQRRGIPCWISSHDIRPGEDYQKAIVTAVKDASVFLLLFSENANKSTEIPHELALAGKYKKTVIPARLQDIVPSEAFAYTMTSAQFIDLFHDFDGKINDLCVRLAELLEISDEVAQRMRLDNQKRLEDQKSAATRRKLKQAAAIAALVLLFIGGISAWWMLTQHGTTPSTPEQGVASENTTPPPSSAVQNAPTPAPAVAVNAPPAIAQPTLSPPVAQNLPAPAPSPVVTAPPAIVQPPVSSPVANNVPTPLPQPVVNLPPVAPTVQSSPASLPPQAVVSPPSQTVAPPPAAAVPIVSSNVVSSNPVAFAPSPQTSTEQYAQALKTSLATLAISSPFVAGKYVDANGQVYTLHGPGVSLPGLTSWSIELDPDPAVNQHYEAVWTTGPANLNPDLANQKDIGTLPDGFSYGFARPQNGQMTLIGARVMGNTIQISSFADNSGWTQSDVLTVSLQEK